MEAQRTQSTLGRSLVLAFVIAAMACAMGMKISTASAAPDLRQLAATVANAVSAGPVQIMNGGTSNETTANMAAQQTADSDVVSRWDSFVLGNDMLDTGVRAPLFSKEQLSDAFVVPAVPEGPQLYTVTNTSLSMGDRIIVAGGTGSKNAVGTPTAGMHIPEGATVTAVQYPAELFPLGMTTYDDSVAIGVADMEAKLDAQGGCGFVWGYSQGARVSGDVANSANNPCVTGVNIGDPRTPGTGIEINMPQVLPGASMNGERGKTASRQVYICREWDPICAFPEKIDPINLANALAGYFKNHPDYANVDAGDRVVKTDGKDTFITLKDSNGVAPLIEVLREVNLSSPMAEDFINEVLEPAEIGTNVQPPAPVVEEPTQAIDNGIQMLEAIAPPQIVDQVQTWVDQGTQIVEDFANGGWVNEAPATYAEPSYGSYSAPAMKAFDAPIQQVQEIVNTVAPQLSPVVNDVVQQGMTFANSLMAGV